MQQTGYNMQDQKDQKITATAVNGQLYEGNKNISTVICINLIQFTAATKIKMSRNKGSHAAMMLSMHTAQTVKIKVSTCLRSTGV